MCPTGHFDMLASKSALHVHSNPRPWVPSCGPEETPPAQKVIGCRARRIKQSCGDFLVGGRRDSGHCGGRPTSLSQLLLHVSYVVRHNRSVGLDPRIESHRTGGSNLRVNSWQMPDPTLMCCAHCCVVFCPACCEKIPQAPTRLPGRAPLPHPSPATEPSQPPTHPDRQPCHTYRDPTSRPLLFGCVIHAGRGVPHRYGTT